MEPHLKISDFVKVIPRALWRPVERRSWLALVRCLFIIILFQLAIWNLAPLSSGNWTWNLPLHLVLIFFAGLSLVGLFVLCHDCGHYSFSQHDQVNDVVGFLCFIPLLNSFFAWRAGHDFHHNNNQIRRIDPDWSELLSTREEYLLLPWYERLAIRLGPGSLIGILIGFWVGMLKRTFFTFLLPQMKMDREKVLKLYLWNLFSAILTAVFVWQYGNWVGLEKFVVMYILPVLIAASTGAFLTFLQHSHPGSYVFDRSGYQVVLSQIHSTFNVRFSRLLEFFWLDINVHVPHHVLPSIPWYHLRKANEHLKEHFPNAINERKFSLAGLLDSWRSTTLEKVSEGVYQMVKN